MLIETKLPNKIWEVIFHWLMNKRWKRQMWRDWSLWLSVGWNWYIAELLLNCKSIGRQMSIWRVWPKKTFGRINKYSQDLPIGGWKIATWEAARLRDPCARCVGGQHLSWKMFQKDWISTCNHKKQGDNSLPIVDKIRAVPEE